MAASKGFWRKPSKPAPKGVAARIRYLFGRKDDPKKAAQELGVTPRTVKGWLSGKTKPSKANAAKLEQQTSAKYERAAKEAAKEAGQPYIKGDGAGGAGGLHHMRLNGPVTMMGQSGRNYARPRSITHPMTADQAERVSLAYAAGDLDMVRHVAGEVLADYFNTGGGYNFAPADLDFDIGSVEFS